MGDESAVQDRPIVGRVLRRLHDRHTPQNFVKTVLCDVSPVALRHRYKHSNMRVAQNAHIARNRLEIDLTAPVWKLVDGAYDGGKVCVIPPAVNLIFAPSAARLLLVPASWKVTQ